MLKDDGPGQPDFFRTGLLLALGLRLILLMAMPADSLFAYGDFQHHYNLAVWSLPGQCPTGPAPCWPLLDYWYEYPPLFAAISIGLVRLLGGGELPPFHVYGYGLAFLLLVVDVANMLVLRRIAQRLYGAPTADWMALAYGLMPAPLVLGWWTFDGLTTLWTLLGLWAFIERRDGVSSLAIGLGVLTKLVPVLLLAAVWRARPPRQALAITAGVLAVVSTGLAPFYWRAPAMTVASLRSQASKSSYATLWAMLDGNLQTADGQPLTGNFGGLGDRFDAARATVPLNRPSRVPGVLTLLAAGGVLGLVWLQSWRQGQPWTDQQTIQLLAFTWTVFLLWSKGWSPQWQQMLVPLILLTLPNRSGLMLALVLAAVSFLEWPVLLSRGLAWGYWLTIPLRTVLVLAWGAGLARELWVVRLPRRAEVPA